MGKMLWNLEGSRAATKSRIREFSIHELTDGRCEVQGWYNNRESFYVGIFMKKQDAWDWIDRQME